VPSVMKTLPAFPDILGMTAAVDVEGKLF